MKDMAVCRCKVELFGFFQSSSNMMRGIGFLCERLLITEKRVMESGSRLRTLRI